MRQPITEEDNMQEQLYKDAREQTLETLPEFLRHLTEDDDDTICHAIAAGAVATPWDMLYPRYRGEFEKIISKDTWNWLQEKAALKLQEGISFHPEVKAHLESIVHGNVPFGYIIEGEK